MPHQVQDISTYHAGDALEIETTVRDDASNIVDISGATEIEWLLKENETDTDANALLTKTQTGGGITFTTDGTDGKFTVKIDTGDTDGMSGAKHHRARVTDGQGDRATVFHGTFTISP